MSDYISILSVILFAVLLVATFLLSSAMNRKEKDVHEIIEGMTLDAIFIAIILLMTFVPNLGFIAVTPFVSFTLMHLPVLLGAALGGWKKGLMLGFVFGLASYMQALSSAGFNALFAYPWVAIPPRMLFGLAAGLVFSLIGKISQRKAIGLYYGVACAGLTMLHTGLVFLDLFVFYPDTIIGLFSSTSPVATGTALTFTIIILLGMAGEMALAAVLIPTLYSVANAVLPSARRKKKARSH
ncbi:MAG: ECF transporter S component [Bacilli bacterium]|nr:ECF transporter S component [Bacilli bacterium]